jgi:hypothetical protein
MAAYALSEERELAINPIVGTSVQHNNQVCRYDECEDTTGRPAPGSYRHLLVLLRQNCMLTIATGYLEYT